MFSKIAALTLVVPFVSALTLNTPENLASGGSATITWTTASGDPSTFSIELLNTVFHNSFAIANNVNPSSGTITLDLPIVPPGNGYTLEAVDISNITNVYASSGGFSVAPQNSTSTTATSSASGSAANSTSHISYTIPGSSSGFGVTQTNAPTATTPSAVTNSGSTSSSASAASSSPSSFNSAPSLKVNSMAIGMLSAIAGAAVFAL